MSENPFAAFTPKKEWLVCVDSDGCAMDTMDVKHIRCFGPCMVKEWGLEEWQDQVLERWNEINLYSMTRGINRFLALAQALTEVDKNLKKIDAPGDLKAAQKNGVLYYPILVKHEKESWQRFVMEALPKFLEGTYEGAYAEEQIHEFKENLS